MDVINLDGAQAASHSAPGVIMDNFGLPTISALCRASRLLDSKKARDRVSLIVGGGLQAPGDFLKAMALGADGVEIGSFVMFAVEHNQEFKVLPFEPPTQMLWHNMRYSNKFNQKEGAKYLANFLRACTEEMRMTVRALGKTALRDLSPDDLFAVNEEAAKIANIPILYQPQP